MDTESIKEIASILLDNEKQELDCISPTRNNESLLKLIGSLYGYLFDRIDDDSTMSDLICRLIYNTNGHFMAAIIIRIIQMDKLDINGENWLFFDRLILNSVYEGELL